MIFEAMTATTLPQLIRSLRREGVLKSPHIEKALARVHRKDFVLDAHADAAYRDAPLPIGKGQTISQPYTVVFMLELLRPQRGERVMDVGSGSGWQSALLADMVGRRGRVYAIEIVPALCELGKRNAAKYPELFRRIEFYCRSATPGLPEIATRIHGFDGIISAAEIREAPKAWRQQLKTGGRLVYPKSTSLFVETKNKDGTFRVRQYPGFAFVPFVER